jgi:hypothetical protein
MTTSDLSFAKTPSDGQVVDRSALTMPRSGRSGRRSPCLHGVDPGDNSTVFRRRRFPSCSPARWWSGRDRGTGRDSLESDRFRRSSHCERLLGQLGAESRRGPIGGLAPMRGRCPGLLRRGVTRRLPPAVATTPSSWSGLLLEPSKTLSPAALKGTHNPHSSKSSTFSHGPF